MVRRTTVAKRTPKKPEAPWWDGLSRKTAHDLIRRGYASKEDAMLFVSIPPRFANQSPSALATPFDPLYIVRPWLHDGAPTRLPIEVYNEVREWLGAEPIVYKKP